MNTKYMTIAVALIFLLTPLAAITLMSGSAQDTGDVGDGYALFIQPANAVAADSTAAIVSPVQDSDDEVDVYRFTVEARDVNQNTPVVVDDSTPVAFALLDHAFLASGAFNPTESITAQCASQASAYAFCAEGTAKNVPQFTVGSGGELIVEILAADILDGAYAAWAFIHAGDSHEIGLDDSTGTDVFVQPVSGYHSALKNTMRATGAPGPALDALDYHFTPMALTASAAGPDTGDAGDGHALFIRPQNAEASGDQAILVSPDDEDNFVFTFDAERYVDGTAEAVVVDENTPLAFALVNQDFAETFDPTASITAACESNPDAFAFCAEGTATEVDAFDIDTGTNVVTVTVPGEDIGTGAYVAWAFIAADESRDWLGQTDIQPVSGYHSTLKNTLRSDAPGTLLDALDYHFTPVIVSPPPDEFILDILCSLPMVGNALAGTVCPAFEITIDEDEDGITVDEGDAANPDSYTVALSDEPSGDVTVTVTPDDQVTIAAADETDDRVTENPDGKITIEFTSADGDWNGPVTIDVTAIDDDVDEADPHTATITHEAAGAEYEGATADANVDVADDDTAALVLNEDDGVGVVEGDSNGDSYKLSLDTEPTGDVTVTVAPDDQVAISADEETGATPVTDGNGDPTGAWEIFFTNADWDQPRTITVTAIDDDVVEGPHEATVSHEAAGAEYDDVSEDLTVDVTDFGILVDDDDGLSVAEGDANPDSYTVELSDEPTADVTVTVTPDDQVAVAADSERATANEDGTLSIAFTDEDWDSPVTIDVTAIDDDVDEADPHTATIRHEAAGAEYEGATADANVDVADDDTAALVLNEDDGVEVAEGGTATDSFTVKLDAEPSADVVVTLTPDEEITISADGETGAADNGDGTWSITFTPANYDNPARTITVEAVDDDDDESATHAGSIELSGSGASEYNGLEASVSVDVTDNDVSGLATNEGDGVSTSEGGADGTYDLELATKPTADVSVTVAADDDQIEISASGTGSTDNEDGTWTIVFTADDWGDARTVTVTAVDDDDIEGEQSSTISHDATSDDAEYDGESVQVSVTVHDNELVISDPDDDGFAVSEDGPTSDSYTIELSDEPSGPVQVTAVPNADVTLASSDSRATLENDGTLTIDFTSDAGDWDDPVTVTVTAVDDADGEGPHTSTITHTTTQANSAEFDGASADVAFNIEDNDQAILVDVDDGVTVTEGDTTGDSFDVALSVPPSDDVTVTVSPDDQVAVAADSERATANEDGTLSIAFTDEDWDSPVTIDVTAANDGAVEGEHEGIVSLTASGASEYNGLDASVTADVVDDDLGVIVDEGDGVAVTEGAETGDSYSLALSVEPSSDVAITIAPDADVEIDAAGEAGATDNGDGTWTIGFTSGDDGDAADDWNMPRFLFVTAPSGDGPEGPHTGVIAHSVTQTGGDEEYHEIDVPDVEVAITDDDVGIVTDEGEDGVNVKEGDAVSSDTYTVSLSVAPDADNDVTVTITPAHLGEETEDPQLDPQVEISADGETGASAVLDEDDEPTGAWEILFTSEDWDEPRTITVTAIDDDKVEGDHVSHIVHEAAQPGDDETAAGPYDSLSPIDVLVDIEEAKMALLEGADEATIVTEGDSSGDTYQIILGAEPTSNVVVTLTPDSQVTISADGETGATDNGDGTWSITFTPANYENPARTITVQAVDDNAVEGPHTGLISHLAAQDGGDQEFAGSSATLAVTINDDNVGIVVDEGDGVAAEEGASASDGYDVYLSVAPTAGEVIVTATPDEQVQISSSDDRVDTNNDGTLSITFTDADWDDPVAIDVKAVDDNDLEKAHSGSITHEASHIDDSGDSDVELEYHGETGPSVTVSITDNDDNDSDGVANVDDNCANDANANQADMDDDGVGDVCDPDRDGDGIPNSAESASDSETDPDEADSDDDGYSDGDSVPANNPAEDEAGHLQAGDNCPAVNNPSQADNDGDGIGDACDEDDNDGPTGDMDGDGVENQDDNCVENANADQADHDGDGIGDECDQAPEDGPDGDLDGDGFTNAEEQAAGSNPNNADSTPDDVDGDGVPNAGDNCVTTPNADQADADNDGVGDACDSADPELSGVSVDPATHSVGVSYSVVGEAGVESQVFYSLDDSYAGASDVQTGAGAQTVTITGLAAGHTFNYKIVATNPSLGGEVEVTGTFATNEESVAGTAQQVSQTDGDAVTLPEKVSDDESIDFAYSLPAGTQNAHVELRDEDGNVIRTIQLTQNPATGLWEGSGAVGDKGLVGVTLVYTDAEGVEHESDEGTIHAQSSPSASSVVGEMAPVVLLAVAALAAILVVGTVVIVRKLL